MRRNINVCPGICALAPEQSCGPVGSKGVRLMHFAAAPPICLPKLFYILSPIVRYDRERGKGLQVCPHWFSAIPHSRLRSRRPARTPWNPVQKEATQPPKALNTFNMST